MAFDIVQVINKFLKIKPDSSSADGWENPFGNGSGQLVVSSQESWQSRLARLGATRTFYTGKVTAPTAGVQAGQLVCRAPKGTQCFITHATLSTGGPGIADMIFAIGNDIFNYRKYISGTTGGSFEVNFDGVYMISSGSDFSMNFTPDNNSTIYAVSAIWVEVEI